MSGSHREAPADATNRVHRSPAPTGDDEPTRVLPKSPDAVAAAPAVAVADDDPDATNLLLRPYRPDEDQTKAPKTLVSATASDKPSPASGLLEAEQDTWPSRPPELAAGPWVGGGMPPPAAEPQGPALASEARPAVPALGMQAHLPMTPGPTTPSPAMRGQKPDATLPGQTLTAISSRAVLASAAPGTMTEGSVRQVGRYLIKSRIGRGGMATVYRANDPQIARDVAIKFLHASLSEDAECHARFIREARAAGGLQHPNIVVVHDVGAIEGRPFMAMELIEGMSLADLIEQVRQMPIRDAVVMGVQLARALDYAHARGIVHRDIKPGNIMVLPDRKSIKVTDFGIAHMDDGGHQHTRMGAMLGTPQYMSPEQTRGERIDGRSDLFAAGIVLYQMVTGQRPFRGDSVVAVATKIANEPAPAAHSLRPDLPPALRRVIDRCLAKLPAQRFQTGKELADALVKVLAEIDEAAREKARPRIVPLRLKWALAMATVVALVMGSTAALITQRQYAALMVQATDYGASLARFIARQNAASALAEDWEVVDVAVNEMMKTGNFERIIVIDPGGVVRASSLPSFVGQPYRGTAGEPLGLQGGVTGAVRYQSQGASVLGFEAPISFQDKPVGQVALGIPEKPLTQVAQLSGWLMVILALVTVGAVAVAMYALAQGLAKPIRLVSEGLDEILKGNLTHRIGESRKDEFGLLFAAFDRMAQGLQQRETDQDPATMQRAGLQTPAGSQLPPDATGSSGAGAASPTPGEAR